jgi:hypothetical protein
MLAWQWQHCGRTLAHHPKFKGLSLAATTGTREKTMNKKMILV